MPEYKLSTEYKARADKIISVIDNLKWINEIGVKIAYVISDEKKRKPGNVIVNADCHKVEDKYKLWIDADYIITIYEDNILGMSEEQIDVILWHELLHIGIKDDGELTYIINPHDIEDFREIVDRLGTDWAEYGKRIPSIEEIANGKRTES